MYKNLWTNWSRYWEYVENQFLSLNVIDQIISDIQSPILVVGAGQGLIVKYLTDKGFKVQGIDNSEEMIKYADKRHKLKIINADAIKLPFKNNSFNTVIISSGVIDYLEEDDNKINSIIFESLRVLSLHKNLFICFYKIKSVLENIYKKIGVVDEKYYYMRRIFQLGLRARQNPIFCVFPIMKWTKKNIFSVIYNWTKLGLNLPKELLDEENTAKFIINKAKKDNIDSDFLINSLPEFIPYRNENKINDLINNLGLFYNEFIRFDDSFVCKINKSIFMSSLIAEKESFHLKKYKMDTDYHIKAEDISMQYRGSKEKALNSINIVIKKGTVFGLLGPNGAGKTTTLSILSGLIKPTHGVIKFSGYKLNKDMRNKIGYIPQELSLYPRLTAKENIMFFSRLYNIKGKKLRNKTKELLDLVGLYDRKDQLVEKFSSGMQRRLNFAIGLVNDPEILLMDEPTVGIDPQSRNKIYQLVIDLKNKGITILYTTHYMEEANKLCDNIAIIDRGRIMITDSPKLILQKYGVIHIAYKIEKKANKEFINQLYKSESIIDVKENNKELIIVSSSCTDNIEIVENIKKIAKKNNFNMSLVNILEPTIENIFLEITGRSLRDIT